MVNRNELWVAEYCPTQNAVHVETLAEALRINCEIFRSGNGDAWMILGVFDDYKEASNFAGTLQRLRDKSGQLRDRIGE